MPGAGLDVVDAVDGGQIDGVDGEPVKGVGGQRDDLAGVHTAGNVVDQALLGLVGMEAEDLCGQKSGLPGFR